MLQNALILRTGPQTRRSSSHCSIWRLTLAEQTVKNNETVLVYETPKSHHDAEYVVRYSKFGCSTSELGQSHRFWRTLATSAVHLTSDISVRSGFRKV